MFGRVVFLLALSFITCAIGATFEAPVGATLGDLPTTPYLKEIFLGRCLHASGNKCDCWQLWDMFFNVTAGRPSEEVVPSDYEPLLQAAQRCAPYHQDKTLLWSGVGISVSEAFSNNCDQYCTLGDTLPSKMLNSLGWCGSVITDKYYNYTYCPAPIWNVTHWNGARYAFFEAASRHFASMAKGNVTILLGATKGRRAFSPTSTFARDELPMLVHADITSVSVLVVRNMEVSPVEKCGSGSLVELFSLLEQTLPKHIAITCTDDPPAVRHLLCAEDPYSLACSIGSEPTIPEGPMKFSLFESLMMAMSALLVGMLLSFIAVILFQCRRTESGADDVQQRAFLVDLPSEQDDILD